MGSLEKILQMGKSLLVLAEQQYETAEVYFKGKALCKDLISALNYLYLII